MPAFHEGRAGVRPIADDAVSSGFAEAANPKLLGLTLGFEAPRSPLAAEDATTCILTAG